MTKPIAIIQTGQPVGTALKKYGHFRQWFITSMSIDEELTQTYAVYENSHLPKADDISGVIVTGSPSMVTQELEWSEKTIDWLKQFLTRQIPVLGVCYGHQMLAKMLGGNVDWNPHGRQMGQVEIKFTDKICDDRLFNPLLPLLKTQNNKLPFLATHQQAVITLPNEVTVLGSTTLDPHHCFRYKQHLWGLQFHPEFSAPIIKDYITARSEDLINEGFNPKQMIDDIGNDDHGSTVMQSFKDLCLHP